jgi:hypothetical protein
MPDVIRLEDRRRKTKSTEGWRDSRVIIKIVDGEEVECINVDTLSEIQKSQYLSS